MHVYIEKIWSFYRNLWRFYIKKMDIVCMYRCAEKSLFAQHLGSNKSEKQFCGCSWIWLICICHSFASFGIGIQYIIIWDYRILNGKISEFCNECIVHQNGRFVEDWRNNNSWYLDICYRASQILYVHDCSINIVIIWCIIIIQCVYFNLSAV